MAKCNCLDIDEKNWNDKEVDVSKMYFYTIPTPMFLHLPIRMASDISAAAEDIRNKGYKLSSPPKIIFRDALFKGLILVEIENPQKEDFNVKQFSGKFYSFISKGPWKNLTKETIKIIKEHKIENMKNVYFWYLTCPLCSSTRGEKTVILIEHV